MKALVYHGPGQRGWDTVDDPTILDPTDALVRIDTSTICGTDLHILKGDVPETTAGTVLGHEAVGTVQEVGAGVSTVAPGDRVLMSCISSCGSCRYCREARYGQCLGGGGWIFGHLINGLQAEYARVPFADNSVYKVPEQLSGTVLSPSTPATTSSKAWRGARPRVLQRRRRQIRSERTSPNGKRHVEPAIMNSRGLPGDDGCQRTD